MQFSTIRKLFTCLLPNGNLSKFHQTPLLRRYTVIVLLSIHNFHHFREKICSINAFASATLGQKKKI